MRAAVYQGKGKSFAIENVNQPVPSEGQVLVKVYRCGICGSDLHMTKDEKYGFKVGDIPGHEFAGEVAALGAGVDEQALNIGDRVVVMPFFSCGKCQHCLNGQPPYCKNKQTAGTNGMPGAFAQYAVADAQWCIKLPDNVSFEDAALVEPLAVALRAVLAAEVKAGDRVLVIGAGAIGLAAVHWAKQSGAGCIAVSDISTAPEQRAYAVGANCFIAPEESQSFYRQVLAGLGGEANIVFDCAGVPGSLDNAVRVICSGGKVVSPGFSWKPDTFSSMMAMIKEANIKFTNFYSFNEFNIVVNSLANGNVEPRAMITDVVSLDDTPQAFELLKGRHSHCKIQISPWQNA